jgi:hypothetical protein
MDLDPDRDSLQTKYAAAVAEERAYWKKANDATLQPVERVMAYGAWLSAAERAMNLALKLREPLASPPPMNAPT